jgi:hypothetical protein
MEENTEATLSYVNDDGDEIRYTRMLTTEGLANVLMAMDDGQAD